MAKNDHLVDCIKNLSARRRSQFELILVNNGSFNLDTNLILPYVDTYITTEENKGAYLARNIGELFTSAPILLFLDDDSVPARDIVRAHLKLHNRFDIICARGRILPLTDNPLNEMASHYDLGNRPFPIFADIEGNTSYRADIFFKTGGWDDEIIMGGGGIDLAVRLAQIEPDIRKQIYSPKPLIYHDFAENDEHLLKKRNRQERSRERLLQKHPGWKEFIRSFNKFHHKRSAIPRKNRSAGFTEFQQIFQID